MGKLRNYVNILTDEEVHRLHIESLDILESVGMKVPHEEVLSRCKKAGFVVDDASNIVRFPKTLVNELLQANKPERKFEGPMEKLSGGISTQVFIVDYPGNVRRLGTLRDVRKGILLTDTLKNIYSSSAVVIPSDYPSDRTDLVSYREISLYSKRPGGTYILSPKTAPGIIEMGRVIGQDNGYLLETVSPLGFMHSSLEMALIFADAGMPIGVGPMVIAGASAPMTIWGTSILENAEALGTHLVIYALTGKFEHFLSFPCHTMDLHTTLCSFGSPNQATLGIIAGQMGRFYGWGSSSNSALSDGMLPDFQYGFETGFNGLAALFGGAEGIGAQGIFGADQGISLELIVLANDWIDAYRHVLKGVEYDEEALELIKSVGIAGTFMGEEHTVEHMRDVYWQAPSKTFVRDQWEQWHDKGMGVIYDKAHAIVEEATKGFDRAEPVVSTTAVAEIEKIYKDTLKRL